MIYKYLFKNSLFTKSMSETRFKKGEIKSQTPHYAAIFFMKYIRLTLSFFLNLTQVSYRTMYFYKFQT